MDACILSSMIWSLTGTDLPLLLADTKARLDDIVSAPNGVIDPFDKVYKIVFQLTMRTVGCNDIANDPQLLFKTLRQYETIEKSATPTGVIFPWLPTPAKLKRTIAGGSLYMTFRRIVNERKKTGKRDNDALQFMIDQGDDVTSIIAVSNVYAWKRHSPTDVLVRCRRSVRWPDQ